MSQKIRRGGAVTSKNVANKLTKADLGGIAQQVNGVGIGDQENTRVPAW